MTAITLHESYSHHVTISTTLNSKYKAVTFFTLFEQADNKTYHQKYQMFLTDEEIEKLANILVDKVNHGNTVAPITP